jgi:hypothetical protein
MKPYEIEAALDKFVTASGLEVPDPVYLTGEINLKTATGHFYSDEAHLYCLRCAEKLLAEVRPHLPKGKRDEHRALNADPSLGEDTCSHCMVCGRVLDYVLTSHGVASEIEHFEEHPPRAPVHAETAFHIPRLIESDPKNTTVMRIAEKCLGAIVAGTKSKP